MTAKAELNGTADCVAANLNARVQGNCLQSGNPVIEWRGGEAGYIVQRTCAGAHRLVAIYRHVKLPHSLPLPELKVVLN